MKYKTEVHKEVFYTHLKLGPFRKWDVVCGKRTTKSSSPRTASLKSDNTVLLSMWCETPRLFMKRLQRKGRLVVKCRSWRRPPWAGGRTSDRVRARQLRPAISSWLLGATLRWLCCSFYPESAAMCSDCRALVWQPRGAGIDTRLLQCSFTVLTSCIKWGHFETMRVRWCVGEMEMEWMISSCACWDSGRYTCVALAYAWLPAERSA